MVPTAAITLDGTRSRVTSPRVTRRVPAGPYPAGPSLAAPRPAVPSLAGPTVTAPPPVAPVRSADAADAADAPHRWGRIETALLALGGLVAAWLLSRQVRQVDLPALLDAVQLRWALLAMVLIGASFVGAAWNLMGFSAARLALAPTVLVQVAGGFVKVISPAAVGSALLNARYLRRIGSSRAEAVTSIGAAQFVQFLVTVAFLGGLAVLPGSPATRLHPDGTLVSLVALAVAVLAGAAWLGRRHPRVRPVLHRAGSELSALREHAMRNPARVALGVTGSVVLVLAFALGLASSVRAFGGPADLLTLTVVFLAGSAAGSLVPSPGGLGTVEAALVTGLVASGQAPEVAVPAVLWFRLVSVWVPVPLGWLAVHALRRRALL